MKAIVKTRREYGMVEIRDRERPAKPNGDEVLVDIRCCAICGSDLHSYEYVPTSSYIPIPLVMGHEFSGVVRDVGEKVKDLRPGDRVMGESNLYCGYCENCRTGKTHVCTNVQFLGLHVDGAMTEQIVMREQYLHRFPEHVPFEDAASAQPCAVSAHGVFDNCKIFPGDDVVVFGPGIIGYSAAQFAKMRGAKNVFIAGVAQDEPHRLTHADQMGLIPVNLEDKTLESVVLKVTGKKTADVVLECSGASAALNLGIGILKKRGYLTLLGIFSKPVETFLTDLIRKEIQIRTSYSAVWSDYERTIRLLSEGLLKLNPLCKMYEYTDFLMAFQEALDKKVMKPVLRFSS